MDYYPQLTLTSRLLRQANLPPYATVLQSCLARPGEAALQTAAGAHHYV